MPPKLNCDDEKRMQDALEFARMNPTEKGVVASRIFGVNYATLQSRKRRQSQVSKATTTRGGQNKILSEVQNESIRQYIRRSYEAGYGATKAMVFEAIAELKRAETPPKPAPSKAWFSTWIRNQAEYFHTIRTRPIDRVRVSAHNIDDVRSWFQKYKDYCEQIGVKREDVFNFDEVGFRVGVALGQEVLVPSHIKEVCL